MKTPEKTSLTKKFHDQKVTLCLESQQMIPKLPKLGKHIEFHNLVQVHNTPKLSVKSKANAKKDCLLIIPLVFIAITMLISSNF